MTHSVPPEAAQKTNPTARRRVHAVVLLIIVLTLLAAASVGFESMRGRIPATFTVRNGMPIPLQITPLAEGNQPLPITADLRRVSKRGGFELEPGQTLELEFACEDFGLAALVVDDGTVHLRQVLVSPPHRNPNVQPAWVVDARSPLVPLDAATELAYQQALQPHHWWKESIRAGLFAASFLVLLALAIWPFVIIRRRHRARS